MKKYNRNILIQINIQMIESILLKSLRILIYGKMNKLEKLKIQNVMLIKLKSIMLKMIKILININKIYKS